jgi:hypothetical protein
MIESDVEGSHDFAIIRLSSVNICIFSIFVIRMKVDTPSQARNFCLQLSPIFIGVASAEALHSVPNSNGTHNQNDWKKNMI